MQKSTKFLTLLLSLSLLVGSMAFITACGDEETSSGTSSSTESDVTDTSDTEEEDSDADTSEDEDVVDNGDGTTTYSFEAEYVDLTYISGHGYSNEVEGVGCIVRDDYGANASNGYFVGYLYEEGNELEFYIYSDQDVSGAKLYLRATMEYQDYTMSWQEFEITVNDGDPIEYQCH